MKYTKIRHRLSVGTIAVALVSSSAISIAKADEMCADDGQRVVVRAAQPEWTVAEIATSLDMSEAAVISALPADQRVAVPVSSFFQLWDRLRAWEDALLVVDSLGSIFELPGALPTGTYSEGYFNLDNSGRYTAHLKTQSLAAIYLYSKGVSGHETHQVAFFDDFGRRAFSVYVPRENDGRLQPQPHAQFLRLKEMFEPTSEETMVVYRDCVSF